MNKLNLRLPMAASLGLAVTQMMTHVGATTIMNVDCPQGTFVNDMDQCQGKIPNKIELVTHLITTII